MPDRATPILSDLITAPLQSVRLRGLLWVISAALMATTTPVEGQPLRAEVGGYAKHLTINAGTPVGEFVEADRYWINLSRLRLQSWLDAGDWLSARADFDTEVLLGSYASSPAYRLSQELERPTFADLDWRLSDGRNHDLQQRFHRLYATADFDAVRLRMGRQRIHWGTGSIWNPTDVLNPVDPTQIERAEERGVDAVHVSVPRGVYSNIELAFAPGWTGTAASLGARASTFVRGTDVSVMGGRFRGRTIVGGDFAATWRGAGISGEAAYTFRDDRSNYLRAILNADHMWRNGTRTMVELFLNGLGATSPDDYEPELLLNGEAFNLGRHYAAGLVSHPITPLLEGSFYTLFNMNDQSALLGPALQYSMAQDLDLQLAAYLLVGSDESEFGGRGAIYFATLQYYF